MGVEVGRALVVTSGRARGSLAALRALGRAGWYVGVGTPDGDGIVTHSRWCRARHRVPRPRGDGQAFLAGVRDAVRAHGYEVVFGGSDDWMAALATYREDIPAIVAHPGAATVTAALDKLGLTRRAAAAGIAAPRTVSASPAASADWEGTVVVKCRSHWHPEQRWPHRIEARRYADVRSARARVELLANAGFEPLLQRPVDGRLGALVGLFDGRHLVGRVQQETSGLWPTPSGVSSRACTVPVDEALAVRATSLLAELGWSGLVELQFLTPPGGEPHLIDLNGRFYGSMALATAAGPNLPDAWARQALGLPVPDLPDGRAGVRYVWEAGDLRRACAERRGGLVADVTSTVRQLGSATTSAWDPHDRGPTLDLVVSKVGRALRRVTS